MRRLTQKQLNFAMAYVETGNRVEAYRCAYDCGGMTDKTARRRAQDVAELPQVVAKVEELQAKALERNEITVDRVLQEYHAVAFSNIADYLEEDGGQTRVRSLSQLTPAQQACVKKFKVYPDGQIELELHDKLQALDRLGRYFGMFQRGGAGSAPAVEINIGIGVKDHQVHGEVIDVPGSWQETTRARGAEMGPQKLRG